MGGKFRDAQLFKALNDHSIANRRTPHQARQKIVFIT